LCLKATTSGDEVTKENISRLEAKNDRCVDYKRYNLQQNSEQGKDVLQIRFSFPVSIVPEVTIGVSSFVKAQIQIKINIYI
jgi:hypothetical protein